MSTGVTSLDNSIELTNVWLKDILEQLNGRVRIAHTKLSGARCMHSGTGSRWRKQFNSQHSCLL